MPRLVDQHIEAERRLRLLVTNAVGRLWTNLPSHDKADVDQWLSGVVPLVTAGQRQSIALTDAYLARAMERQPLGVDPEPIIANLRNGISAEEAYRRPFVTMWAALGNGKTFADALSAGGARAEGMAAFDVQAAMRDTALEVGQDDAVQKWERVADGEACAFCLEVDGAILNSDDAMPLHPYCGCSIEPLTEDRPATPVPETVAVEEHGELGPVLGSPDHAFTSQDDI